MFLIFEAEIDRQAVLADNYIETGYSKQVRPYITYKAVWKGIYTRICYATSVSSSEFSI